MTFIENMRRFRKGLRRDNSGVAMVEFAFMAPILLVLGVVGIELANLAILNLRISQAAMHIADNGSRIGDRESLSSQKIYESDIDDLFRGVDIQAGAQTDIFEHGRVIVSSLEQNSDGGQWIHWQRCMGKKNIQSAYGPEGTGATGTDFEGMGPAGRKVTAPAGQAVIYVELEYDYQPLVNNKLTQQFVGDKKIVTTAAFTVRGSRDLGGIYQRPTASPVHSCNLYTTMPS